MPAWCALITGITVGSPYIYMTTILYEGDLHISGKNKKIISSGALPLFDFNPYFHHIDRTVFRKITRRICKNIPVGYRIYSLLFK